MKQLFEPGLIDVFVYHGYEVDFSAHGVEGLQKALSGKFDLILLDVMLPGLNGFEICRLIREHDRDQAIIMLTAKNNDEDIIEGLSLGGGRLRRQAVFGGATGAQGAGRFAQKPWR